MSRLVLAVQPENLLVMLLSLCWLRTAQEYPCQFPVPLQVVRVEPDRCFIFADRLIQLFGPVIDPGQVQVIEGIIPPGRISSRYWSAASAKLPRQVYISASLRWALTLPGSRAMDIR